MDERKVAGDSPEKCVVSWVKKTAEGKGEDCLHL